MKRRIAHSILLIAGSLASTACGRDKAETTTAPTAASAAAAPAEAVETGGSLKVNDWGATGKKEVTMKIGRAFAYAVTTETENDEGNPQKVHKLAEIVLYNEGAKDVSCDTKITDFDGKKLLGGNHYAVLLRGRNFMDLEFGESMDIGDEYERLAFFIRTTSERATNGAMHAATLRST